MQDNFRRLGVAGLDITEPHLIQSQMDEHVDIEFGPGGLPVRFATAAWRITAWEETAVRRALEAIDAVLAAYRAEQKQ